MKTHTWYQTPPGLCPAAVTPPPGYARTAVGAGAIPDIRITGVHGPPEIQNLTPGIFARFDTFRDIEGGLPRLRGQSPPQERHEK